ncbi:MAG TPA: hypothetical protein DHW02_12365 [Ktedonobacter sp.]|nr:hypothetical protein [Ktedonobacter sp.]
MNAVHPAPTTSRQANKGLTGGLIAGLIAGLIIAIVLFADYGPANDLRTAASWIGLDHSSAARLIGFFVLIILGGIFGLLFGFAMSRMPNTLGRSIVAGLITGFVWWLIVVPIISVLIHNMHFDFGSYLYYFVPLLAYGMLLGTIYYQRTRRAYL